MASLSDLCSSVYTHLLFHLLIVGSGTCEDEMFNCGDEDYDCQDPDGNNCGEYSR